MSLSIQQLLTDFANAESGWLWEINTHAQEQEIWQAGVPQQPAPNRTTTVWGLSHEGNILGNLQATGPKNAKLTPLTLNSVQVVKPLLGEILALRRKLTLLESQASHDFLTGLLNRRGWEAALNAEEARCRRYDRTAAIVTLDLDNLKVFNDTQGHAAGDELLQKTASCLRSSIRPHDLVARLGGDEFGLLLIESAVENAPLVAERLRKSLALSRIAATFGWAARTKADTLQSAWKKADLALVAAKRK